MIRGCRQLGEFKGYYNNCLMHSQLLCAFTRYAFNHSAQILISFLQSEDLQLLLSAIENSSMHGQLAHLIRARMFVLRMHQVDRTLYFVHFADLSLNEFNAERCNVVATVCPQNTLKTALAEIAENQRRGEQLMGEDFVMVREAMREPDLPLPPIRRETVAPHCQTVYQVVLACQKLNYQEDSSVLLPGSQQTLQYFFELLQLHIRQTALYLSLLSDPFQHFAELTYRFMVYRNTVLALHSICPFDRLAATMDLWLGIMGEHYRQSNEVFLEIAGFKREIMECQYGRFSKQMLKDQGYLNDYVEGLIDLSVDENNVAFCGHSRQLFGPIYSHLEDLVVSSLKQQQTHQINVQNLRQSAGLWSFIGLKPSSIRRIMKELGVPEINAEEIMDRQRYCRQDQFIETCANIHGLTRGPLYQVLCY